MSFKHKAKILLLNYCTLFLEHILYSFGANLLYEKIILTIHDGPYF